MQNTKPKQVIEFEKQHLLWIVRSLRKKIRNAADNEAATIALLESVEFISLPESYQRQLENYKEKCHPVIVQQQAPEEEVSSAELEDLIREIDQAKNNQVATLFIIQSEVFARLPEYKKQEITKYKDQRHPVKSWWRCVLDWAAIFSCLFAGATFLLVDYQPKLAEYWSYWFGG